MAAHLRRLDFVAVRESRSVRYLAGIGVQSNVVPVVDTAFLMMPQPVDTAAFWPRAAASGVVGLNISWLIDQVRRDQGVASDVVAEAVAFIAQVLQGSDLGVLLVPHVAPLDGNARNNDDLMNQRIREALKTAGLDDSRYGVVPSGMNAAQLKYIISECRFLLAARTHATIAAFSSGVPTVSIAYSVKAEGINEDLFGHQRYVLQTPAVSASTLWSSLVQIRQDEPQIRARHETHAVEWRRKALDGAQRLKAVLQAPSDRVEHA